MILSQTVLKQIFCLLGATTSFEMMAGALAGSAVTSNITLLNTESTVGTSSTQTQPGGGSPGFPNGNTYTLNYGGAVERILSYKAGTVLYNPLDYKGSIATTLVRVPNPAFTGNQANNNNIIYSRLTSNAGSTYNLNAPYLGNEQQAFNANNLNYGTDNLFGNTGDGNGNNNNIERLDVVFRRGLLATSALAFAVFERGVVNAHDPFGIAAVTAVDAEGRPTAYGPLVRFGAGTPFGSYGTTALVPTNSNWLVTRNQVANQGALATSPSALVTNQTIGGVTIAVSESGTSSSLGVAPGTVIYGYSLFGGDITGTGGQNLLDPSTFPLNSSSTTGAGGIDLVAYTGVVFEAEFLKVEIPSLVLPDQADITTPNNLKVTSGNISVISGEAKISEGSLTTPGDLTLNPSGETGTLISDTPIAAGGNATIACGTLVTDSTLTTKEDINVTPLSSLVVNPNGSASAGQDVNVQGQVDVSGGISSSGDLNLLPGGSVVVQPGGTLTAGNDVTVDDPAILIVQPGGKVEAGGGLEVSGGAVDVLGEITVKDPINLQPNSIVLIEPTGSVSGGGVQVGPASVLIVDGGLCTPGSSTTIAPGGGVTGTGTITGNVENHGNITPGDPSTNTPGTLHINGNYEQGNTGTLGIPIDPSGASSQLVVSGTATLGGSVVLTPSSGTPLAYGQKISDVLSAKDVSGTFSTVDLPEPFRGRPIVDGGTVSVLIAPQSYSDVATTPNQQSTASALDSFIPAKSGDKAAVSTALDELSAEAYPAAFEAVSPAFYQTIPSIGFNLNSSQSLLIDQRLDSVRLGGSGGYQAQGVGPNAPVYSDKHDGKSVVAGKGVLPDLKSTLPILAPDTRWGAWTMANGIFGRSYSLADVPNYRFSSGQFLAGTDLQLTTQFSAGLFAGYQTALANYAGGDSARMNGVTFGTYATYNTGTGFYASGILTGGYANYETSREISFGSLDRQAAADLDSGSFSAFLKTGYDFRAGSFTFGPILSGQYTCLGVAPFTETGADSLNLRVNQQNANSLQTNLGARLAWSWKPVDTRAVVLTPEVRMFWNHEFLQNPTTISAALDGGNGASLDYVTTTPSRDSIFAGAGVTARFGDRWNASAFYNSNFAAATTNTQMVSLSIGCRW